MMRARAMRAVSAHSRAASAVVLLALIAPGVASAQIIRRPLMMRPRPRTAPWDRIISVSGGWQASARSTGDTVKFTAYGEQGDFDVTYKADTGPLFDIGGAVRVWRNLGVGGNIAAYAKKSPAAVSARIPHPFVFDRLRDVSGDTPRLQRQEVAVHVVALWMIPVRRSVDLAVFGGPSYFHVSQPFVGSLRYAETYPYDSTTLTGANTTTKTKGGVGFHAGVDVTYMVTRTVGIGGVLRYSEATVTFTPPSGERVQVKAGGPQAGAGIRFRF